jgi:WD40 repeat protein/lipoprotein NlpI/tRNA A-37 threonylcarbamoyl transferase component Bud32
MNELQLFEATLEQSPSERAAFLDEACAGDVPLRQRLEALLTRHEQAGRFLEATAAGRNAPVDLLPEQRPGAIVAGRFKLLEPIGEGGMGTVWAAVQTEPVKRRVALKLVKPGMDTRQVLSRFEAERQALALMDHPNIAKVYDGGITDQGRPFFVMEYVKGVAITDYCDDERLSIEERLKLFLPVCHAVQHAHQKGIIHRDLKPSNILVCLYDGHPVPKVIDFGLAKAMHQPLTEHTLYTAHGEMVGTPLYMSPEQAELNNLDVDTRTDVYSLGVILYELLTGTTPLQKQQFKGAAFLEILRLIKEQEPLKPSLKISTSVSLPSVAAQRRLEPAQLSRTVRGDLDWVVMKALEKERSRRYETVSGLARDVDRYLSDEAVEACPPSSAYRLRKYAHKYRRMLATAAGFLLLLVCGTVLSIWQAARATRAEILARQERDAAITARATAELARDLEVKARQAAIEAQSEAKNQGDLARYNLYVSQIQLARRCWEDSDPASVRRILSAAVNPSSPDIRNLEWRYLDGLLHEPLRSISHEATAGPVISPDGRHLATGHRGHVVRIISADTLEEVKTLRGNGPDIVALAFDSEGRNVVTVGSDQNGALIDSFDVATGVQAPAKIFAYGRSAPLTKSRAVLSPDAGVLVVDPGEDEMLLWDVKSAQPLPKLRPGGDTLGGFLTFSPDGKMLAWGDRLRGRIMLWDVRKSRLTKSFDLVSGHPSAAAFRLDGRELLVGDEEGNVIVWDIETGTRRSLARVAFAVLGVAYRNDGKEAAVADAGRQISLVDLKTGSHLRSIRGHISPALVLVYYKDDQRVLSANGKELHSWDARVNQGTTELSVKGGRLAYSSDGKALAITSGNTTDVFDGFTGQRITRLGGYTSPGSQDVSVAFRPESRQLGVLGRDGSLRVWDVGTGVRELVFRPETFRPSQFGRLVAEHIMFNKSGPKAVTWSTDGPKLWDAITGQVQLSLWPKGGPSCLATDAQGNMLAAARPGGPIQIWELKTGKTSVLTADAANTVEVAFSHDGKYLATAGADYVVHIWDIKGQSRLRSLNGHAGSVTSLAFSPDDSRLATASYDTTVRLWDTDSGRELLVLKGHRAGLNQIAFRPDGAALASVSSDGKTLIWQFPDPAAPSDRLAKYFADQFVEDLVFNEDIQSAIKSRDDWSQSFRAAVWDSVADRGTVPSEASAKLWQLLRRDDNSPSDIARLLRTAERLHRRLPNDLVARRCLAFALYYSGRAQDALTVVNKINGDDEDALRFMVFLQLKRLADARLAIESLLDKVGGVHWEKRPHIRQIASVTIRNFSWLPEDSALSHWKGLLEAVTAYLGEDLDQFYDMSSLRHAYGVVLAKQGLLQFNQKNFLAAESLLVKSHEVLKESSWNGNDPPYREQLRVTAQLILLFEKSGQISEAVKWRKTLSEYHAEAKGKNNVARSFLESGMTSSSRKQYDQAIADYDQALAIDPKYVVAYNQRGLAWFNKKEFDTAISDYDEVIKLDPKYMLGYFNRGNAWRSKGNWDKAILDYDVALALDSKYAAAYNNRGLAWRSKEELDKALADFDEALRVNPKYAIACFNRGFTYLKKANYSKAVVDFNEAVVIDPKYAAAQNAIAWLRATCPDGQYREGKLAVENATKACELTNWRNASYIDTLAAAYAETSEFAKAIEWQSKAIEIGLDGRNDELRAHLELYQSGQPYRQAIRSTTEAQP